MRLQPGDRVAVRRRDEPLPRVQYGTVSAVLAREGLVALLLDDELGGEVLGLDEVVAVAIDTLAIEIDDGADLLADPGLRRHLTGMWCAEADRAGLALDAVHPLGDGQLEGPSSWALAEVVCGGRSYVLCASLVGGTPGRVSVCARWPNRWD